LIFWKWLLSTFIQGALIFYCCFSSLLNAPEMYESSFDPIKSGKMPDLAIISSVLLAAVVIFANLKLLFDTSNINEWVVLVNIGSSALFFAAFMFYSNRTDHTFNQVWHYPQYILCVLFFCLSIWPLNNIFHYSQHREEKEERLKRIVENTYRKEKHKRE
jgi:hypothetical protein